MPAVLRPSPRVFQALVALVSSRSAPHGLVERGKIILALVETQSVAAAARLCAHGLTAVVKWRTRWLDHEDELEAASDAELDTLLRKGLAEKQRPGHAPKFTPEQVAQTIALACESAVVAGVKLSQWTLKTLAEEAVRRGIAGAETMIRGTLRNPGWCPAWAALANIGYLREDRPVAPATTFAGLTEHLVAGAQNRPSEDAETLTRLEWLGLFSPDPLPAGVASPLDALCSRLEAKLAYAPGERDWIILFHEFVASYPDGSRQTITSTFQAFGVP